MGGTGLAQGRGGPRKPGASQAQGPSPCRPGRAGRRIHPGRGLQSWHPEPGALRSRLRLLILPRHLPFATRFVDQHPTQVFVLDHVAKPLIRDGVMEPWARQIRELALRPNVYCKVSGMVTEAHYEVLDRAAAPALFRGGAGGLWSTSIDVRFRLARVSRRVRIRPLAQHSCRTGSRTSTLDEQARVLGGTAKAAYRAMKALRILTPGRTEVVELPKPVPQEGEVLLRVRKVGLCGSDSEHLPGPESHGAVPSHSGP